MTFLSGDQCITALRAMIDRWCDERKLNALSRVLPGYLALKDLTDGWVHLYEALKSTRGLSRAGFSDADWKLLDELIRGAERIVYRP